MGSAHSQDLPDDEKKNLDHAQKLWNALKGIPGLSDGDAFIHFLRILHLGMLVLQAPTVHAKKQQVSDVLCCGISEKGSKFVGANVRLRMDMAGGRPVPPSIQAVEKKLGVQVSAFNDTHSKLHLALLKEDDQTKPPLNRPFENCAEHVVFEKLARVDEAADTTYAVQKIQQRGEKNVKCVKRCENCLKAGGESSGGGPFGRTPRLGAIVTDHPSIANLSVPINTAPVMMFIRSVFRALSESDRARVLEQFPYLQVWHNLSMSQATSFAINGSDEELKPLLPKHQHDEL